MPATPSTSEGGRPPSSVVRDLLQRLPEGQGDAIALARTDRLTYRHVAFGLGISEATAKRRIRAGLRRLHAEMVRVGVTAT